MGVSTLNRRFSLDVAGQWYYMVINPISYKPICCPKLYKDWSLSEEDSEVSPMMVLQTKKKKPTLVLSFCCHISGNIKTSQAFEGNRR